MVPKTFECKKYEIHINGPQHKNKKLMYDITG